VVRGVLVGVIIAAAAALGVVLWRGGAAPSPAYSTNPTAWVLPALTGGGTVQLAGFHGKPLVLDFFASWCTSCEDELPAFVSVDHRLAGRVRFAGVDSEENGNGLALARRTGIASWPLARDVGGSQASGLRDSLESIPGMPITAFYDANGRLRQVRLGALSSDALAAEISRLYGITA
jgi:thiol-disulfide isomerase/thioredoxin